MNVCIIGAGAAGLCSARQSINHNITPTILEQTSSIGGTWVYTNETGVTHNGLDVHSSMYKGLRTNLPKEVMCYPDFTFKEFFPDHQSYISSETILKFLQQYADHFDLRQYIKFNNYVLRVRPIRKKWEVYVIDLERETEIVTVFDYLMVCNGHYNTPLFPEYNGFQKFKGLQIHSHDYRDPQDYKDQLVLIIGSGPSGLDICNEVSKYAKSVTLSHRLQEIPKTVFKKNVILKPSIKLLTEDGVQFNDNSIQRFNTIIYCTGYKYSFPFLNIDCGIFVDENFVQPLYKHCVNIEYSSMAFIGIPFYVCAFQMMDLQVRFVIKQIWQNKNPPSRNQMIQDTKEIMKKRWKNGFSKRHAHMMGPEQGWYYDDLSKTAKTEPIGAVNTILHNESSQRFLDDLVHFRDDIFKIVDDQIFIYYKKASQK